jgi:bacterioferritin-associated ferredoxin
MLSNTLTYPLQVRNKTSTHDQVQIALAIAEEHVLKSLLVNCTPAIAKYPQIGSISSTIGVPMTAKKTIDGIIQFESIQCVLADTPVETAPQWAEPGLSPTARRRDQALMRCESELHTLGQTIPMAQAIALLAHSGFSPRQVEDILNLPYEAWHKTWWCTLDSEGNFTIPFLRFIRTLRYPDGSFTLQYKDYFSQEKPTCFSSRPEKVLVEIKPELGCFSKTLEKINYSREHCQTKNAILICNSLTDLETQGFISQGISLYSATELILPIQANCAACGSSHCPMRGRGDSPVVMCRQFYTGESLGDGE